MMLPQKSLQTSRHHWEDYQSDLGIYTLETDIRSNLMKIIMYTVLKKRFDINKIKRIVNL